MKLKALPNRLYNIIFHTHTVAGLLISALLYIIFFAGAFTLFKNDYFLWEHPELRQYEAVKPDFDKMIPEISSRINNFDWEDETFIMLPSAEHPLIRIFGHVKKPGSDHEHVSLQYHPASDTYYEEENTTIGETLYRLHFLDQIPYAGRYIAGLVALFFLFTTFTGVLIHWKNILNKFTGFSLKGGLKQLWTSAHTVFGLLGLPFQIMYAVTGAFYLLSILILAPVVLLFFNGDREKAFELVRPTEAVVSAYDPVPADDLHPLGEIMSGVEEQYPDYRLRFIQIKAYGRADALVHVSMEREDILAGEALLSYSLKDGSQLLEVLPGKNKGYKDSILNTMDRLHFGDYGGIFLRVIYFLLALITCFIIISGILLWKAARNKNSYTPEQKRFHHRVTIFHLAVCLGLFPAVPVLFCAELLVPYTGSEHVFWVRTAFFISWLLFVLIGLLLKTEMRQTYTYLFLAGIGALAVPVVNGIQTGDWFWGSLAKGIYAVAVIDLCWLFTGILCLVLTGFCRKRYITG